MSKLSSLMEAAKQNKKKTAIIAVVVLIVLTALFMRFKGGSKGGPGGGPGGPGGMQDTQMDNVATVAAENPKIGTIERTTSTSGTVEASDVVYVYAKASGDVTGVNVSVGDMVTAGQLLCTINTEQVETAKNAMDSASVNLTEAQSNLSRMQLLYQGGDISDQEWEQYQNQAKTAQLNYESAKLNYDRQVEYSSVTAPISGKIETMDIDVYDHVNQQVSFTLGYVERYPFISGEGDKRVSFYVSERVMSNLNQGDEMTIVKGGTTYDGVITDVSSMADESNGLFKIKAELPEANSLSTGSTVKVTVTSERAENVMTVPVDAIYYDNGVGNVYVYQDGTVHKVEVEVGLYNTELAEIKSGLTADELVISTWSSQLYEGSTVNLKGEETDAAAADEAGNQKADAPAGSENGQKAGAPADGGNDQPAGGAGAPNDAKNGQKQ